MPKLPFSTYAETRLLATVQKRVNVYPNSNRGVRQFPGNSALGTQSGTVALLRSKDISAEYGVVGLDNIWMNEDGSVLVAVGGSGSTALKQYDLTTPFDVSTLTYAGKSKFLSDYSLPDTTNIPRAVDFSPDGSVMFVSTSEEHVYALACSVPFDIDSATYTAYVDLQNQGSIGTSEIRGIWWRNGDEMWVGAGTRVHRVVFAAGTDYAVNRSVTVTSSSALNNVALVRGLDLNTAGTELRVMDSSDDVYRYTLTSFDPSTIAYVAGLSISGAASEAGLNYRDGDKRFYICRDSYPATVYEYSIGGAGRGMKRMGDVLYCVIGPALYSMDRYGAFTSLGAIANDPEIVGMATDGTRLVIAAGSSKYYYTVAGGLVAITDIDLQDSYTTGYLDQRFYFSQPSGQFVASEIDDPASINGLDFAEAESFDDDLLRTFTHNQLLYHFGATTTEVWISTGTGRPPVERQQVIQRGVAGKWAVGSNDNMIYFLDNDRRPNKMLGIEYQPIFTPALGKEFDSYASVSDCIVNCYSWQQERFAEFSFPSADATWTYHENSGTWSKRESDGGKYRVAFYENAYGGLLGLDSSTGTVYQFSSGTYTDNAGNITRTIDSVLVSSELYGVEGEDLVASELNLAVSCQAGGSISVSHCTDPGSDAPSFSTARSYTCAAGVQDVRFYRWGKFKEAVFRVSTTANDRVEIIDAELKVEPLGG